MTKRLARAVTLAAIGAALISPVLASAKDHGAYALVVYSQREGHAVERTLVEDDLTAYDCVHKLRKLLKGRINGMRITEGEAPGVGGFSAECVYGL